jgi:hypothetical protein
MNRKSLNLAAATIVAIAASTVSTNAQTSLAVGNRSASLPVPRPRVTGFDIVGTWSGTVVQVQSAIEYSVVFQIFPRGH